MFIIYIRERKTVVTHTHIQHRNKLLISGMILSNKEKTGKLCNSKSGRPAHVEDMSRARRSRCAFLRGFGGMPPQENFCFQHGFLDF